MMQSNINNWIEVGKLYFYNDGKISFYHTASMRFYNRWSYKL
jgi:hypothetical protein